MEYIAKDRLISDIENPKMQIFFNKKVSKNSVLWAKYLVNSSPAADVVPVVRGEWLPTKDDNKKRCSKCDVITLIAQYPYGEANFCPNCGADMRQHRECQENNND